MDKKVSVSVTDISPKTIGAKGLKFGKLVHQIDAVSPFDQIFA